MKHKRSSLREPGALWIVALALLSFPPGSRAGGEAPPGLNQGPMIRLEERRWAFGEVMQETKVEHQFLFRNDGTAPLRILKIDSDCGCTLGSSPDSVLLPGESSHLKVTFDSGTFEGDLQKVVILYTNDPAEPRIDLGLTATVIANITSDPMQLDLGVVKRGDSPTASTRLTGLPGVEYRVTGCKGGEEHVTWSSTREPPKDGAVVYRVTAKLRPDAPTGPFTDRIEVLLDHPKILFARIFVHATVYSYFQLSEERLSFEPLKTGRNQTKTIRISSNGSKPYKITGVKCDAGYLTAKLESEGNDYVLSVTLHAPSKANLIKEQIILTTTDPAQPEIPLVVRAMIVD